MWVACVTGYHSAGSAPPRPLCGGDGMDRPQTTVFVGCRPSPLHLNRMAFFFPLDTGTFVMLMSRGPFPIQFYLGLVS